MRFSSFGDVLQCLSVAGRLAEAYPKAEIHWVTRREYQDLIASHPKLSRIWALPREGGVRALLQLGRELRRENYTHVYDAHNNLRSRILGWQLKGPLSWRVWTGRLKFLRRSIYRWRRYLLFSWRINTFPRPFSGQFALLEPLAKWGISTAAPSPPQLWIAPSVLDSVRAKLRFGTFVALAPSAAFALKRWPIEHWAELIRRDDQTHFVLLGGPEDTFLAELEAVAPTRVQNLAGQLSLVESSAVVQHARALVANDTGLMHVAEQIGRPCVALMGPAPFGFPSRERTRILERELWCRPCSKHGQGPCINPKFHQCLRDIPPSEVGQALKEVQDAKVDA